MPANEQYCWVDTEGFTGEFAQFNQKGRKAIDDLYRFCMKLQQTKNDLYLPFGRSPVVGVSLPGGHRPANVAQLGNEELSPNGVFVASS